MKDQKVMKRFRTLSEKVLKWDIEMSLWKSYIEGAKDYDVS